MDEKVNPARAVVTCTWWDVPHLSEEDRQRLLLSIPPHQRDARSRGIPSLGAGQVYPMAEDDYLVADFEIPAFWPRCYGLDVGWNTTAAIWLVVDRETKTTYAYSEYYRGQAEPVIHAEGIRARGAWIPGVIDPASQGRSQVDGQQLLQLYRQYGLQLTPADNAVEAGIAEVWGLLSSGKLKLFKSLGNLRGEMRMYRRDDSGRGRIVKENDHGCDALRYAVKSGLDLARTQPVAKPPQPYRGANGWMS